MTHDLREELAEKERRLKKREQQIKEREEQIKEEIEQMNKLVKQDVEEKEESIKLSLEHMFSIHEDAATNEEIKKRILSGGKITGTNMVVMVCAILIASVGLNTNSVAVIIGAMLISPLMGSILAVAYGTASNNAYIIEKHLAGLGVQVVISVVTATLYFMMSPVKEVTEQLLARTQPRFFDVIVAIAGGVAGIVGQTRADKSNNIIPGVAIATALMPPLCTVGYGIATFNIRYIGGAFYLFMINAYFIYASASVVLALLRTPHVRALTEEEWKHRRKKMLRNTILILLPVIVIGIYDLFLMME